MDFNWLPQIDTTDILSVIVILQTGIILGRTPKQEGKHRKRKRFRRGKRQS